MSFLQDEEVREYVYIPHEREAVFRQAGRNSASNISTLLGPCLSFKPISKGNVEVERKKVSILRLPAREAKVCSCSNSLVLPQMF